MNPINVAFCVNNGYVPQLLTVINSVMVNNKTRPVNVYIFSSDMTDGAKQKIAGLGAVFGNLSVNIIAVDNDIVEKLPRTIEYISAETYFRYLIADMLPHVDKILYLDADLIVDGDISALYDMDISDYWFAGANDLWVLDTDYKSEIHFDTDELYVNAGVLLMNLGKIRREKLAERFVQTTRNIGKTIKYQDQDIINIVCRGHIKEFDSIYNYTSHNIRKEKEKLKSARIIHYTGKNKPWLQGSKHKLKKIWDKYSKTTEKNMKKKIKVALLIDEFFGGAGTAFGGYGFLARKYIAKYIPCDNISVDVLLGRGGHKFTPRKWHVDDVDLYRLPRKHWASRMFLRKKNYDVYLSIELTDDWVLRHETNKNKRLILWVQDPRPWSEWREIQTMKLLPEPCYYNQSLYDFVNKLYRKNRVTFVSQGMSLNDKAKDLYRLSEDMEIQFLPNPVDINDGKNLLANKQDKIIFLGRVEDVKRGWIFCEVAKRMPEYQFHILGKINTQKEKTRDFWEQYKNIPNLHFEGHVDGNKKEQFLREAKILMNTSIHEGVPISFLEALSYGCCLVSNRNPDNLSSNFGIWVGNVLGDGFDKIDLYVNAIKDLMTNDTKREKLACAGRKYIEETHNIPRFVNDLRTLIYDEVKKC